ncbi:MAG: hypothetical protein JW929_02605 [Anaerolineales bacterium]|nr:hypothetical protein [Anaerolineales bacterium]
MTPFRIIRESVRITFRSRSLWMLALLLYLVMIPALILTGGLGAAASTVMLHARQNPLGAAAVPLPAFSAVEGILLLLALLFLLTVTSLLSWAVQAAMVRAADAAANGETVSVCEALNLGRERWVGLLKLAFTLGFLIQALGILPALFAVLLRDNTAWGSAAAPLIQTFLSPFNVVLGVAVFLLMMSIALEGARPRTALGRIGQLVRAGWRGFLLAYLVQGALALTVAFVFAFVLALVLILIAAAWLSGSTAGTAIAVVICLLTAPVGAALMTFVLVFSTVYFTLTYREAAAAAAYKKTA